MGLVYRRNTSMPSVVETIDWKEKGIVDFQDLHESVVEGAVQDIPLEMLGKAQK